MARKAGGKGDGKLPFRRVLFGLGARQVLGLLSAVWRGEQRSTAEDAELVVSLLDPPPLVEGRQHVPSHGPFVVVGNHYEAPGLWVGWAAAAVTSAIASARAPGCQDIHWLVHPEWRWFEAWGRWVPTPWTSLLFPRAIKVWGMVSTPARPSDVAGRARALRHILTLLKPRPGSHQVAQGPIGLFPEGTATFALQEARPGSGAFLHRINKLGVPLLPVGVFHENNTLVVRFGQPFFLGDRASGGEEDLDAWARRQVMVEIGRLLPERLWGYYATSIAADS